MLCHILHMCAMVFLLFITILFIYRRMRIFFGFLFTFGHLMFTMAVPAAGDHNEQCSGDLFILPGQEKRLLALNLDSVTSKLSDDYQLRRWDGQLGNYTTHLDWMYTHAQEYSDPQKDGFRPWGKAHDVVYEIHDGLTKAGGGDGYFRLSAEVDISPQLLIAQVLDAQSIGKLDPTVMYMNMLHTYGDLKSRLCLWIAAPGFPFSWRMGLDLTTWRRDEHGNYWQLSLSVPSELDEQPNVAIHSVNRYWAYKLEPLDDGKRTKLTLLCQTSLFGWMPQFLVNMKVGEVLADYVRKVETTGKLLTLSGAAAELIETYFGKEEK